MSREFGKDEVQIVNNIWKTFNIFSVTDGFVQLDTLNTPVQMES